MLGTSNKSTSFGPAISQQSVHRNCSTMYGGTVIKVHRVYKENSV